MRIGLVLSSVPAYSETFFRSKIRGLVENGHEVIVFANNPADEIIEGCKIVPPVNIIGNPINRLFESIKALVTVCSKAPITVGRYVHLEWKRQPDLKRIIKQLIINSHILPYSLDWLHFGFATMGLKREFVGEAMGAKVAASIRGYDISIYPLKHPECYSILWSKINKLHTISHDLLNVAYKHGLPNDKEVVKITPAIMYNNFTLKETRKFTEPLKLLSLGRLHWKKGMEYVLKALAELKQSGIKFTYTIVGDGDQKERLVFAVHQLNLQDRVKFIGKVSHHEVPQLLFDHDVFIQYSIQEGFCNAVIEAQASGMLSIVSDAEGLSENVEHDVTGFVVPRMQSSALSKAIQHLHELPVEEKIKMSVKAQERVRNLFDLHEQNIAFNKFYTD